MGIHTGEVERVGDDFRGRPVNRAARIMAVGHGGQILLSDVAAALVRSGPSPVEFADLGTHRLRDLTEPERVWQVVHPDLPQRLPARARPRHLRQQPAGPALVAGRPRPRRRPRRRPDPAAPHRDAHRRRRGRQDPARRAGRRRPAVASSPTVWFVELASVADPDDVADAIALHHGARRRDRSAGRGRGDAGRRATRCSSSTTASTSSTAPPAVIDALTARLPRACRSSRPAARPSASTASTCVAVRSLDPATTGGRAVPAAGGGRRRRPRVDGPLDGRARLPPARRHPAGHRAGGGPGGDARACRRSSARSTTGSAC